MMVAEYDVPEDEIEIRWTMCEFMNTVRSGPIDPVNVTVAINDAADAVIAALS